MTVAHAALTDVLAASTDLVLLLYSSRTLPKEAGPGGEPGEPLLSPKERVASLLAYCRSRPQLGVAVGSHGLYADQAEAAARLFPRSDLVFGVGSDKLVQLADPAWYEAGGPGGRQAALDRLFGLSNVAYAVREEGDERLAAALARLDRWKDRIEPLALPPELAGLSSRGVRELVARGRDVADLVPPEVLPFLERRSP
jgi:nicotinic acid mononucleotide adenylyltransferase